MPVYFSELTHGMFTQHFASYIIYIYHPHSQNPTHLGTQCSPFTGKEKGLRGQRTPDEPPAAFSLTKVSPSLINYNQQGHLVQWKEQGLEPEVL